MGNHHTTNTNPQANSTTTVYSTAPCPSSGGFISRRLDRKIARRQEKAMRKPWKQGNLRKLDRLQRIKHMVDGCDCNSAPTQQQPQNQISQPIVNTQQQIQYSNQPIPQPTNNVVNNMVICAYCRGAVDSNYYQSHIAQCAQRTTQNVPVFSGNPGNYQIPMGIPVSSNMGQGMMTTCGFCYKQVNQESLQAHMSDCNYNPQFAKRY